MAHLESIYESRRGNTEYYKLSGAVDWADDIHVLGVRNTNPNLKILLDRLID